jgi:hypothetical protein
VQLLCTHVCKYKNETCETIPSIRGLEGWEKMTEGVNSSRIYIL